MRRRLLAVLVAVGLSASLPVGQAVAIPPTTPSAPIAVAAKACSSGYVHAVISGSEKCLRRGQFCARAADSQYRGYGFRCTRFDANVEQYRLT
jgi:hypothetical protein